MTDFFIKSDISRNDAEKVVSDTLKNCDDGELYLENSKTENIVLDDSKIKNSSYNSDIGYGLRAVTGEVIAYSHSNEISKNSLKNSSENLKSTLKSKKGTYNHSISKSNTKYYEDKNPIEEKSFSSKIKILIKKKDKDYLFELKDKRKFDYETLKYLNKEHYITKINL